MLKLKQKRYKKLTINSKTILCASWGILSAAALGVAFSSNCLPDDTHAATTKINAAINNTGYYLNVSSSGAVNMSVTPTESSKMASAKDQLNVKTNIPTGYKLYMSATSTGTNQNSLYNSYTSAGKAADKITASSGTLTSTATLATNTWGYGIPNTTEGLTAGNKFDTTYSAPAPAAASKWAGVPATTSGSPEAYAQLVQTIKYDNSLKGGNNLDVYYAVNTNTSIASGNYKGNVVYTAVADTMPTTVETFDEAFMVAGKAKDATTGLYKMQDMDSSICSAVKAPTSATTGDEQTTTLVDVRNNITYSVGKLADGNCWMKSDLAIGGSGSITLNTADSDVSASTMLSSGDWSSPTYPNFQSIYYNYQAAIANGKGSVCPKGWTLPSAGQYSFLVSTYSSNYSRLYNAFGFSLSGFYRPSTHSIVGMGQYNYWWTNDGSYSWAPYLEVNAGTSTVGVGSDSGEYGNSVRCVAR